MKKIIIGILLLFFVVFAFAYMQDHGKDFIVSNLRVNGSISKFNTGNFIDDEYDLRIGNNDRWSVVRIGNLEVGTCEAITVGESLTMDGVVLFAVQDVPGGIGEFIFTTAGGDIRMAMPRAGDGLATYNARSGIYAGPSVLKDSVMRGIYWGFNRLAMNTDDFGADLGIQNNVQVGDSGFFNTNITVGGNQFTNQSDSTTIDPDKIETTGDLVVGGKIIKNSATQSVVGPTDNVDVAGIGILLIDTNGNNVTIGAFVNGVNNQVLDVFIVDAGNNSTLEHNEGTANQNIFLSSGADETRTASYGGWKLFCNGTSWFELDN